MSEAKEVIDSFYALRNSDNISESERVYAEKGAHELLSKGYSKDDIISVLHYLIIKKKVQVYSFNYVAKCIDDVLLSIERNKARAEARANVKQQIASLPKERGVLTSGESSQRNRDKSGQFGVKSRFGTEHYIDLFKGTGADS